MIKALLADDEPLLLDALQTELSTAWPELDIIAKVGDGASAITQLLDGNIDVAFLDVQMPVASGIEVMQAVIEDWPDAREDNTHGTGAKKKPPAFVFVSAHQEFAVDAFELAAIDYILKPVTQERLNKTIERLHHKHLDQPVDQIAAQLAGLLEAGRAGANPSTRLKTIRASVGTTVLMIPINEVILFEASDKYVVVHTATQQALIREPLRDLLLQLEPEQFKQIHRNAIVNMDYVVSAMKFDNNKMSLKLREIDHTPVVSRVHRHLFQPM